jgi:hypothetical protein
VERWFGLVTQQAIRRGSFKTVKELIKNIDSYVARYNIHACPFVWTATADSIFQKIERLCRTGFITSKTAEKSVPESGYETTSKVINETRTSQREVRYHGN